jgi:hypothetical protein
VRERLRRGRDVVRGRFRDLVRHPPGLRTAKTVVAAVLSFVVADALHTSPSPVLAPLTALLVVQLTMSETVAHGRERVVSVVAGVLLAVLFAGVTGLTWWSLGLVVAVSLVAGRLLRLGPHRLEVAISAMLVLAVGGAESAALGRVAETLIGAAVGVLVNLLIAPPVYGRPASAAVAGLAERLAGFTRDLATALRGEWSRQQALDRLEEARSLNRDVAQADRLLARAEESARLNPRGRPVRAAEPRLRGALTALEHVQVGLRSVTRALLDRTFFVPEDAADEAYSPAARAALADVLDAVADGLAEAVPVAAEPLAGPAAGPVELAELRLRRDRLAAALVVDPAADAAAWAQHGALLDAVDRLRVELGSALTPPAAAWPPQLLRSAPQRVARRVVRRHRAAPPPP